VTGTSAVTALRMIGSLALVLALVAMLSRGLRGRSFQATKARGPLEVLARQGLARNASVVVLRAADRGLVLGVSYENSGDAIRESMLLVQTNAKGGLDEVAVIPLG